MSMIIEDAVKKLYKLIQREEYRGYDPYDALLSPFLKLPLLNSRIVRFGTQQVLKRFPLNLRRLLLIKKGLNPVTIGLSIQAYSYLQKVFIEEKNIFTNEISKLKKMLVENSSQGYKGICWGYDFDWEARYTKINAYIPTGVATGINTNSLYESYLLTKDVEMKELIIDAANFVRFDLNKSYEEDSFCYSYSPVDNQFVFNASMKAARLLSQVYSLTGNEELKAEATNAVKYVAVNQRANGSWAYANHDARTWADNYHTGYILDCLHSYISLCDDRQYLPHFEKGLEYYVNNFFIENRIPKFYDNGIYPIDSTGAAQSILTLARFGFLNKALNVSEWYIENMRNKRGGFYFRKFKYYTDRTEFMRWSNAWMFTALSYLLLKINEKQ